ncbi:hypothetical protein H6G06_08105 [Anabaena sphaerica FACHB-251]|uniref:Type II secretion system protein GspC N-terminal domain-containing protein n=2 Tax=Anabaena TaxID=1163 RepID=A0A927A1H7_9NOST|nr:hypothetical protein [Anabaena sphaerica FACHB-251]
MIPEASTHLIISEAIEDFIPNEALSIETYAEGLIDDLFTDIDNILDGGRKRPAKTIRTEYVPMQAVAVKMQEVVLPQTVHRAVQAISPIQKQQTSTLVFNPPSVTAIRKRNQKNSGGLGNLLMLGSTLSVAMVGTIYLAEPGLFNNITAKFTPQTLPTDQQQSPVLVQPDPQAELVNYMLEALAVIDQQRPSNDQRSPKSEFRDVNLNQTNSLTSPINQPVGTLPLPVAANNAPPAPSRVTNVVERIYIPVYQAPPSIRPLPEVLPMSVQVSPPEFVKDSPRNVQSATKPIPEKISSATVKQAATSQSPRLTPPKLPAATAPAPLPKPESVPTTTQQVYLPAYSAELEGLLELGNKSAALFKIDSVTRRINLGENIGASGWTLVEVSNGEAIIRRNGEVRSIYAGQKL